MPLNHLKVLKADNFQGLNASAPSRRGAYSAHEHRLTGADYAQIILSKPLTPKSPHTLQRLAMPLTTPPQAMMSNKYHIWGHQ